MGSENKFGRREQKYLYGRKECETIVDEFKKKWIVIKNIGDGSLVRPGLGRDI
jgi:hypothetical protein